MKLIVAEGDSLAVVNLAVKSQSLARNQRAMSARHELKTLMLSVALSSPGSSQAELGLATGGLAEHEVATLALDGGLSMRENGVDCHALGALDVHEV